MDLNNVKVGDEVVVRQCAGGGQEMINYTKVTKVTKTQITVEYYGLRFLKNGVKFGESKKHRGWFTFLYTKEDYNK